MVIARKDACHLGHWSQSPTGQNSAGNQPANRKVAVDDLIDAKNYHRNRAKLLNELRYVYRGQRQKTRAQRESGDPGIEFLPAPLHSTLCTCSFDGIECGQGLDQHGVFARAFRKRLVYDIAKRALEQQSADDNN